MGSWKALAAGRVDESFLRQALEDRGASWETACHVTATASLARSIRTSGVVGLPIATLTDLIVLPGMPDISLPVDGFPGPDVLGRDGPLAYDRQVSDWQMAATGRRMRLGIWLDDELRQFSKRASPNSPAAELLVKSRRQFSQTIHSLIASGISPENLTVTGELARTAIAAWASLEQAIPSLAWTREDLWINFREFQNQTTARARDLRDRVEAALDCAFGVAKGRRLIVHHGFYFYTPPQWALFQLLRGIPTIDQIFIVQDDGSNPAFETWRRFFVEEWDMPVPEKVVIPAADLARYPRAIALLQALGGETVEHEGLAGSLSVLECRSPAELVRHWRHESVAAPGDQPMRFAADARSVERLVRRLGRDTNPNRPDLAQLPIGSFLIALHDCIQSSAEGGTAVVIKAEGLLDIVASGYLGSHGHQGSTSDAVEVLRRSLPFFTGCVTGQQWLERASHLHRLILSEVAPLGKRDPGASDIQRIRAATANPLRLIPWGDLTAGEAAEIADVISNVVKLVEEIASRERVALKDHMQFLQSNLKRGLSNLDDALRREITVKVDGFAVGLDEEIDIDGLVDVVAMLLGRTPQLDAFGDLEMQVDGVRDLRGLDSLGMHKESRDLHVTNLAEGTFPSSVPVLGWPFHLDDLQMSRAAIDPITLELLTARSENAALGDLYLLWLALDGVQAGNKVTLSWISDIGGERRNPSALLSLLTLPQKSTAAIVARAGGFAVDGVTPAADLGALTICPSPGVRTSTAAEVSSAIQQIPLTAAASAFACGRRLALQWILGRSHAFQSDHHHSMLHGNVVGALVKMNGMKEDDARTAANDLWRHLTPGQRSSSYARRVVKETSWYSAKSHWIFTLEGKRSPANGPLDLAYQAASNGTMPDMELIVPAASSYLPPGIDDAAICEHCPVRMSCSVWAQEED